jgi:membrane fusion protein (multidrug efflux system)
VLLTACDPAKQVVHAPAVPQVGVYTLQARSLTLTTDLPGRTTAYRVAVVRPQVNGILEERLFTEGAEVKQGQQLYRIYPRTYEAELARAEANLVTAQNLATRYEQLLETKAVSQQQVDNAVAAWKQAKAEVQMAKVNVDFTKVRAPISGRIGRSLITEGALVTSGQAQELTTVTQLDPIFVDINQPITKMLAMQRALESGRVQKAGDAQAEVTLTLEDGSVYPLAGVLKFNEVRVDQGTGAVALRAVFPNPDRKLLPGMFVHAQMKEGVQENALVVPEQAVIRDSRGLPNVWVVKADNSVEMRPVETLRTVGNAWLIGKGVQNGERVVTEGVQRVQAGIKVSPEPARNVKLVAEFGVSANGPAN